MRPFDSANTPAIVLASGINGLGAVRSLAARDVPVIAISPNRFEFALWSRAVRKPVLLSGGAAADQSLLRALDPFRHLGCPIIATSDNWLNLLMSMRRRLQDFRLVLPPESVTRALIDKRLEYDMLASVDVDLPRTVTKLPADLNDLTDSLGLPIIIKPRTLRDCDELGFKNLIARTRSDLESAQEKIRGQENRFVAQEVIQGADEKLWVVNATYDHDSRPLCKFMFRRLGLSPSHFGVTTSAVSDYSEELSQQVDRIARLWRYCGPVMFEFKFDAARGRFAYIETNPRLGMCNWFDTSCGANNVYATYLLALDRAQDMPAVDVQQGRYFLNSFGDAFARLEDGEGFYRVLAKTVRTLATRPVHAHFRVSDPVPALLQLSDQSKRVARALSKRARRRAESIYNRLSRTAGPSSAPVYPGNPKASSGAESEAERPAVGHGPALAARSIRESDDKPSGGPLHDRATAPDSPAVPLPSGWDDLCDRTSTHSLFMSSDWLAAWWDDYAATGGLIPRGVPVMHDGQLIAFLPACQRPFRVAPGIRWKRLELIGHQWRRSGFAMSEYLDVPVLQDAGKLAIETLLDRLEEIEWSDLVIANTPTDGIFSQRIWPAMERRGWYVRACDPLTAWTVPLDQPFHTYVGRLSASLRRRLVNNRLRLERTGAVEISDAGPGEEAEFFGLLSRLHETRWGKPPFSNSVLRFHHRIAAKLNADGRAHLSTLRVDGRPVSCLYDLVAGDAWYNIQSGFDASFDRSISPGYLHLGYAIEAASQQGAGRYDLLGGPGKNSDFKQRFAGIRRDLVTCQVIRPPALRFAYSTYDAWKARRRPTN